MSLQIAASELWSTHAHNGALSCCDANNVRCFVPPPSFTMAARFPELSESDLD